jgi:exonuclease SbcC
MIRSLKITNWKAFEDKHVTFGEGITFFVGPNGIGKTTLLEAICLAVTGKSQTADFQELIRQPALPSEIQLDLEVDRKKISIRRRFREDRKLAAEMIIGSQTNAMSWDDLTSAALDLLSVDEIFFNRLVYMSEGEVFNYLKDPPGEALNSRIQEILAIANLQALEGFMETVKKNRSSVIREISSELKTVKTIKPISESQITALDNYLRENKQKEKDLYEKKDNLTKEVLELEEEKKSYERLKKLLNERNVSSRMRHFLQEFSVEPPRFLEAVC